MSRVSSTRQKYEVIVIDVTEVERPQKQRDYYSGKHQCHTLKAQVTVEPGSGQMICTSFGKGRGHDFRFFKESKTPIEQQIEGLVDKGYQGIQKMHLKSKIPHRKPRGRELTTEQKQENQQLAIRRIRGEPVHRRLKGWRIIGSRYRNRRKGLKLRLNVIAGIHNYELTLPPLTSALNLWLIPARGLVSSFAVEELDLVARTKQAGHNEGIWTQLPPCSTTSGIITRWEAL